MEALRDINLSSLLDTLVSLLVAFVRGGLIGFGRQFRQRTAGLRTNVLVALGAAIFVDMANRLYGQEGAIRVVAYVVSGIGFLGAGVIMREQGNVRGLNTAATLWCSAAVGACAGADLTLEAVLATVFVLAANTLLRPVVNMINRLPLDTPAVEVTNTVHVITTLERQKEVMALVETTLEDARYPIADLGIRAFGEDHVEIEATLSATSLVGEDLDRLVARFKTDSKIAQAFWSPSTCD